MNPLDVGPLGDWEIWSGCGGSLACLVEASDVDRPWLTKLLRRRYRMEGVTQLRAEAVFARALRGGYLLASVPAATVNGSHGPQPSTQPEEEDEEGARVA